MELALGKYVIPAPSPAEIDDLMSLPEGTPAQLGLILFEHFWREYFYSLTSYRIWTDFRPLIHFISTEISVAKIKPTLERWRDSSYNFWAVGRYCRTRSSKTAPKLFLQWILPADWHVLTGMFFFWFLGKSGSSAFLWKYLIFSARSNTKSITRIFTQCWFCRALSRIRLRRNDCRLCPTISPTVIKHGLRTIWSSEKPFSLFTPSQGHHWIPPNSFFYPGEGHRKFNSEIIFTCFTFSPSTLMYCNINTDKKYF